MKNLDTLNQQKMEIRQRMQTAISGNNAEDYFAALDEYAEQYAQSLRDEFAETQAAADRSILAARGTRQLTAEETKYFTQLGNAMRTENPRQAISDIKEIMPKTTIDAVFEDLVEDHPLLDEIDFTNTSGLIEVLVNQHEKQLGVWGELTEDIKKELSTGFKKIPLSIMKYTAFLPVAKSILDLGPAYLETYVRKVLSETIYVGLEKAILTGDGDKQPIGMNRQVGSDVSVVGNKYPEKTPEVVTSFDPVSYGALLAKIATTPEGKQRKFDHVLMVVSPKDYFDKVFPATTIRGADGTYVKDVLPFPTRVIPSLEMPEGKMILGRGKSYFMASGLPKDGKIEYDDSVRFLEDERVYLAKIYGYGEPKDNNAFLYCDISGLQPAVQTMQVVSEPVAETSAASTKGGK